MIDHVGGLADLEAGVLRAIGDPAARMNEDRLRLLRAVRFAATLGFRLDPATARAIRSQADGLPSVSGERIGAEMRRVLSDPNRAWGVGALADLALLPQVAPAVSALPAANFALTCDTLASLDEPASFPLALAALYRGAGDAGEAVTRWRLSNAEAARATDLLRDVNALDGFPDLPLHRKKRLLACDHAADLIALVRAERRAARRPTDDADAAAAFLADTPPDELAPAPLLTGADLIAAGRRPGPEFKRLLDAAYDAQLDGVLTTTGDALKFVS